jgi:hypothetical protein
MTILFSLAILPLIWCLKQAAEKICFTKSGTCYGTRQPF